MTAWIAGAEIDGVVFIDSMVPDLQTLLGGVAPGERAFVLDMSGGGLEQIAVILAANNLTNVGSIAIVGHGASGSINVGTTVLNDGDLTGHAAALKAIGAAVAPGGALDLFSCDTAAGPQGRAFIGDLSGAAGVRVDASTHEIGKTAAGPNWALDAVSPAPQATSAASMDNATDPAAVDTSIGKTSAAASPFNNATTDSYQGTLAAPTAVPTGQVFEQGGTLGAFYLNSNSSTPVVTSNSNLGTDVSVDSVVGASFTLQSYFKNGDTGSHYTLYTGNFGATSSTPIMSTAFENYFENVRQADGQTLEQDSNNNMTSVGSSLAIDTLNHKLYIPIGSQLTSENGLLVMSYSVSTTGAVTVGTPSFLETSTGDQLPSYFNGGAAYYNGNVYVSDTDNSGGYGPAGAENGLFKIATTGNNPQPASILDATGLSTIEAVAIDRPGNQLFFATLNQRTQGDGSTTVGTLYAVTNLSNASATTKPTALTARQGVTLPTFGIIEGIAYDENAHILYVSNDKLTSASGSTPYNYNTSEFDELTLSGTVVTAVNTITYSSLQPGVRADGVPFGSITNIPLSTLTIAGSNATAAKGAPTAPLSAAPTITDYDSGGYLKSATVTVADGGTVGVSGDVLGIANGSTFTSFTANAATYVDNGHTFSVSYAGGVLTIADQAGTVGENTIGAFSQVLQDVRYQNNSTDSNTRTLTYQVNNGAVGNPSGTLNTQSVTLAVAKPPVIVAGGYRVPADVVAGATTSANAPGALTGDTSPANSGTLSVTAVQGGSVGGTTAGTYGSLVLQSTGAYTYTAGNTNAIANAATGSHPVDSYSFTVSNAGGTATEAFAATIDRAPTGAADAATATELGPAVTGNVLANDTDPDGDALKVATVSFNGQAGTVGQGLTGTYGTLTLNSDGTYSYTADDAANYLANSPPHTDSFTYTDSDGLGGASAPTALTFTVTCFATGTCIRVARGTGTTDVPVETLRVGDLAVTSSGARRPIRWIGHRTLDCRAHPRAHEAMPVRIAAHAFGPDRPARDLMVSPGHSICVNILGEVLIPASALLNGTTISQVDVDAVEYWHVELDDHDILLANGLPAESYLEMSNRSFFIENHIVAHGSDLSPDAVEAAAPTHADFCRPFHVEGVLVEAVRAQLAARAAAQGWTLDVGDVFAGLHLVADGTRIEPARRGSAARFTVPAGTRDAWLVCDAVRPASLGLGKDTRELGIYLAGLSLDDGFGAPRRVALDDPLLCIGFQAAEPGGRWTNGRTRLPSALWADLPDAFFLRLDLAGPAIPRRVAPTAAAARVHVAA